LQSPILILLFEPFMSDSYKSGWDRIAGELTAPLLCYCPDYSQLIQALVSLYLRLIALRLCGMRFSYNHSAHFVLWKIVCTILKISYCAVLLLHTGMCSISQILGTKYAFYAGPSKKMDRIWNRYNLKSTRRIYTFGILKCSEKFKVLHLPQYISICAPFVALETSKRNSVSCHVSWIMSRVTVSMSDVILSCRCWIFLIFSACTMLSLCISVALWLMF